MRTWWSYLSVGMGYVIVAEDDGEQVAAEIRDEPTARLMAAAPALLAALDAAPVIRLGESLDQFAERYSRWYREARVPAISRAKGEVGI